MHVEAKIYVLKGDDGALKIGRSIDPSLRAKQVGRKAIVVHETEILPRAEVIERMAHRVMVLFGSHVGGEWFKATVADAKRAVAIAIRQVQNNELLLGGRFINHVRKRTTPMGVYRAHFSKEEVAISELLLLDMEAAMSPLFEQSMAQYVHRAGVADEHQERALRFRNVLGRLDPKMRLVLTELVLVPDDTKQAFKVVGDALSRFSGEKGLRSECVGLIKASLWQVGHLYKEMARD